MRMFLGPTISPYTAEMLFLSTQGNATRLPEDSDKLPLNHAGLLGFCGTSVLFAMPLQRDVCRIHDLLC